MVSVRSKFRSVVGGMAAASTFAASLLVTSPAVAGTRTCVQDMYNFLAASPYNSVVVSLNGMWPGVIGVNEPWAYFGKNVVETGYDAGFGGWLLKSASNLVGSDFAMYYDKSSESSYFNQPIRWMKFQAIPLNDAYPVRLTGNGTFDINAQCVKLPGGSAYYLLTGFDNWGYYWTMSFLTRSSPVN